MNPQSFPGRTRLFVVCLSVLSFAISLGADAFNFQLSLEPADRERSRLPVVAEVPLPPGAARDIRSAELRTADGDARVAQVDVPPSGGNGAIHVSWVEPLVGQGEQAEFHLTLHPGSRPDNVDTGFRFERGEDYQELFYGEHPVYRYVTEYDPARHSDTHKPYHQVYGFHGEGFITKGPGGKHAHHKGIYLGWNQTLLADGQQYDFWHGGKAYQQHRKFIWEREAAGPVFARSASSTDWKRPAGEPVVRDTRDVTTWKLAEDELMLDYEITIQALAGDIYLGGDAHHSGFQFRASQEVAENAGKTVFIRSNRAEVVKNDIWEKAAWTAMSFDIQGNPYTVVHLNHPGRNPHPTTYSTRDYGRFGAFFESDVKDGEPLVLKYRIIVKGTRQGQSVTPAALEALHADYLQPASVRVVKK